MKQETYTFVIPEFMDTINCRPPERLVGKTIVAVINEERGKLEFALDMPDDPTEQELAFFKWVTMEISGKAGLDLETLKNGENQ